jgi:hypothetical protein
MKIGVKIGWNTLCNDGCLYLRILMDGVEHTCSHIILNYGKL